jgi:dienelactone hydrolase
MRNFILVIGLLVVLLQNTYAQSVIDPSDPVINYDSTNPPSLPPYLQMGKWVRTPNQDVAIRNQYNVGWDPTVYKAYVWQNMAFRIRFPKTYVPNVSDGKKYPLIIFLHGNGEIATPPLYHPQTDVNYDNEFQLLQGPPEFDKAIRDGIYDGYVLAPQIPDLWFEGYFTRVMEIVDYLIANNKVDPFHIIVNGLSSGGTGSWVVFNRYPQYLSAVTPMSSPITFTPDSAYISNKRFTPIWMSQGGIDPNPPAAVTAALQDSMIKYGANFKRTLYPGADHVTWYGFWQEPDFWPFINRAYMSNPWMLGGLKSYWPGEPFVDTIGVMPGFTSYEWRLNGNVIPNQNNNTLIVTAPGKYEARVLKGTLWSDVSHVPLIIKTGFYEGESFTAMNGVQVISNQDVDKGLEVGYIDNSGDWVDYNINVYAAGTYALQLRVAAAYAGASVQVKNSAGIVLATITIPTTSDFQNWITTEPVLVTLPAGPQTVRLQSVNDTPWGLNWLQFSTVQAPLPLKFVYFNSQCSNAGTSLQWKTTQEQNTKSFSIQRSTDGRSWSEVGTLAAAGQSQQERSYVFQDKNAVINSMYRIVQYDMNGQYTISSVIKSSCSSKYGVVTLYPNPTIDNSALNVNLGQSTKLTLQIVDSKGALMHRSEIQLPAGNTTIPLNLSTYAKGVYNVNLQYNGEMKTIKLIKK